MKIRKGDTVMVRVGKDKGKTGKVLETFPREQRVLVEGINVVTRHRKQTSQTKQAGKFNETRPIHISKVGLQHPSKPKLTTRVGFKVDSKGAKKRILKANGKEV